ncbi:MAG: aminopeptidase [Ruminococcaceae bacterium]|nr:aminopeptidase [Oscillospiraceae bacterium]
MKKTLLRKYAKLIAVKGINVQKGQDVIVTADLDQPEFVKMVVEECYRAGAGKVTVDWDYQPLTKLHIRHRSVKTLSTVEKWEEEKFQYYVDKLPCRIYLISEDPDGLNGINQTKMAKGQQARYKVLKPYRDKIEGKYQWCIAAVPGKAWAKKVFPELKVSQAVEKLWQTILYTSRVDEEKDAVENWISHNTDVHSKCDYLNSLGIEELEYSASNGTNLRVGLIPGSQFCGGSEKTLGGVEYNPNIPSEECFISPMKGKAEGIVYSSKPLSYQGQLIENFNIRFEDGKAVEYHAEKNEELLGKLITMDENAAYLGECALVPYDSPISNSGILFYNTLFDENAACHLALGRGFIESIKNYPDYTLEQIQEMGVNDSMVHEDFMIGTPDLSIIAHCRDGKSVQIFKDGNWAI